jgi:hypothetical protein
VNKNIKRLILQILNIVLTIILIYLFTTHHNLSKITIRSVSALGLVILFAQIFQFLILKIKFYDFRVWFILLFNLFLLGRIYIMYFNPNYNFFWIQFNQYPIGLILKTIFYSVVVGQVFFTSFLFFNNRPIRYKFINNFIDDKRFIYRVGIIMFVISFPFRLFIDIIFIIRVQASGSFLSVEAWSGISDILATFFVPSIIFLLNSVEKNKRKSILILSILYFVLVMALTGDRRYQTTGIIAITLSYFVLKNNKLKFWNFVKLSVFAYLGLTFLVILRNVRSGSINDIDVIFSKIQTLSYGFDIIIETMSEFGLSFFSLLAIIQHIPANYPYLNGLSFYGSILSLLPVGWLFGDFFKVVSISYTINKFPGGYPVGATIAGDFYANFGSLSFIFIFIFGLFLSKIFNLPSKSDKQFHYSLSIYFSLFYVLINLVRASFFEVFRASIYIYIVPIVIGFVFYNFVNRGNLNENSYSNALQ